MGLKDFKQEFRTFILKGDVVGLAVAVVIGGAFGKIVTALVNGIVMPLVSYVLPTVSWQAWKLGRLEVGHVLGATVDFLVISGVVFVVLVKGLSRILKGRDFTPPPATRTCPYCLEQVPAQATRCKHCTSQLEQTQA
jgi:large conductance mechanosensitive channel